MYIFLILCMTEGKAVQIVERRVQLQGRFFEHYKRFPSKSIGVGTFNIKQQQAIQEEIEELLRQNPDNGALLHKRKRRELFC